jgi:hypothetical protein
MRIIVWILCLGTVTVAHAASPPAWVLQAAEGSCALRHPFIEPGGATFAQIEILWDSEFGDELRVKLFGRDAGHAFRLVQSGTRNAWSRSGNETGPVAKGFDVFNVMGPLGDGAPLTLVLETARGKPRQYSTGAAQVRESVAAFNRCKHDKQPADRRDSAFWSAESQRSSCSLSTSIDEAPGLQLYIHSRRVGGAALAVFAADRFYPQGGVLRLEMPGERTPWDIDTNADELSTDPRLLSLLRALRGAQAVRLAFTPRGMPAEALKTPVAGLPAAAAMFDACVSATSGPVVPKAVPGTGPSYAVDGESTCTLTATYQLFGSSLWLALSTDGGKPSLKITRRKVRNDEQVVMLDLESLGGSAKFMAPDADLAIGAAAFARLRADLRTTGRPVQAVLESRKALKVDFGGEYAVVETAMFDACVHTKYPSLP